MKISCSSWSYHRTFEAGKLDQISWIDLCAKKLKLDGVELLSDHFPSFEKRYLRDLKKRIIDYGLTVACVSASNHFTIGSTAERNREIDKVKRWADIGLFMSAPLIRIFAGGAKELNDEIMWAKVIKALYKCSRYGQKIGMVMALENHGGFSANQVLRMIKEVGSPWLRLTVDTGNFPEDIYGSIEKTIPYASFVHAKFYEFDESGEEMQLDYSRIIEIFRKNNYLGFLSIEYEGEGEELTAVPKAVNAIRQAISISLRGEGKDER